MSRELDDQYRRLRDLLKNAVHELPAGVLYGANGASAKECAEWMSDLDEFARISAELGLDHRAFIDGCRWHFEHYPHYLGRRRHFVDYRTYIDDRGGPLTVKFA